MTQNRQFSVHPLAHVLTLYHLQGNDARCSISDRESLVDELSKLGPEERSVLRGLKRDAVLVRKGVRLLFSKDSSLFVESIQHAVLCTKWMEGEQQSRWKELDHLRSLRHDA